MKKIIMLSIAAFISSLLTLYAQDIKRTWHWNFGSYAGLDFSSGTAVPITNSAMDAYKSCSSISDTNGNLLFYSGCQDFRDTTYVWNRNNVPMPNGRGLLSEHYGEQCILIAAEPLNDSIYYIFTDQNDSNGFRYSIVNMHLDGGLGNVTIKNKFLFSTSSSRIAGVKCSNDTDLWVVSMKFLTDSFYAYRITSKGLDTIPVISKCGRIDSVVGCMKFSPDGTKLGLTIQDYYGFELLKFNDTTGQIYGLPIDFPSCLCRQVDPEGIEFSPDESKIYWTYENFPGPILYQANLLAGSDSAIINSSVLIDTIHTIAGCCAGALQLGPDSKIYLTEPNNHHLGVINSPNLSGSLCNYNDSAIILPSPSMCYYGLPTFVSNYLYQKNISEGEEVSNAKQNNISIYPNPASDILNIKFVRQLNKSAIISIIDITGRMVLSYHLSLTTYLLQIDVSSLTPAMYFIRIQNKDLNINQKFIKF